MNECYSIETRCALNIDAMTMYRVRMLVWSAYHLDEKSLKSCPTCYLSHLFRLMATNMTRTLFHAVMAILLHAKGTSEHQIEKENGKNGKSFQTNLSTSASYVDQLLWKWKCEYENWSKTRCELVDLLYEPETSIELLRSADETAVIRPGELVVNG